MKNLIFISLFLILLSCGGKQSYMCGDHRCIDKKEYNEYFAKNLSIEIYLNDEKRSNNSVDLVKLNTEKDIRKKRGFSLKNFKINQDENKKIQRKKIQEEKRVKKQILKKREIKKNANKLEKKREKVNIGKKIVKLKEKVVKRKTKSSTSNKKNAEITSKLKTKKDNIIDSSICIDIKNCDIDKISEFLIKEGAVKEFPDITLK